MSEFEYDRDPTMGMVSAEEFNAMAARAEKAEADLARAVEERDDYRAKAIQRQHDFDAAAHACDVLQGKLDKAVEERDAALVLCLSDAWDVEVLESDYTSEVYAAHAMLRSRGWLGGERG